uniref:Uncharacterized protein n=1 Tax=Anopheles atroparvus TaxID=41427 RepID=A0A182JBP3_ANOAO
MLLMLLGPALARLLVLLGLFRLFFRRRRHRHRGAYLADAGRPAQRGATAASADSTADSTASPAGAAAEAAGAGVDIVVPIVTKADAIDLIGRAVPHLVVLVAVVERTFAVVHHLQVRAARVNCGKKRKRDGIRGGRPRYLRFFTVYASPTPLIGCLLTPTLLSVVVLPARDRQPSPVPFDLPPIVPYTLLELPALPEPPSSWRAYELSAYAWKQQRTSAFAAASRLQMNVWHSSTLMPVVRRRMAAKMGGCWARGVRANGESSGRNFGSGLLLPRSGISTWRTAAQ